MSKGLNIIAGIDIWDKAYCEDLTQLSPEKFNDLYNEIIDLIVGDPPCQSFNIAVKRDKNDPLNALFMEYLDYFNPKAFIMENVIGMLSEKVIDIIMENLNKNYMLVILKFLKIEEELLLLELEVLPTEPKQIINNRIPVKNILLAKEDIDKKYYLSEKTLIGIQNKKEVSKQKGLGFGEQFLNFDKPSYTIPARYWKDGYDALVKYNEKEIRRLTIIELKRIQTFPDEYILEGSNKDIIMKIGNAVACKFAYHLVLYILQ
jgi:DNA (cytosine-5)-methyltransferase 1